MPIRQSDDEKRRRGLTTSGLSTTGLGGRGRRLDGKPSSIGQSASNTARSFAQSAPAPFNPAAGAPFDSTGATQTFDPPAGTAFYEGDNEGDSFDPPSGPSVDEGDGEAVDPSEYKYAPAWMLGRAPIPNTDADDPAMASGKVGSKAADTAKDIARKTPSTDPFDILDDEEKE